MSTLDRIARFDAVDLDALNADAALQTRVDRKYIVPLRDVPALLVSLPAETRVLEVAGERALRYTSRYFDTPDLASFRGAAHGRRRRFKVRARSYLDSGGTFLEVKTRGGRATTVKDRVPVAGTSLGADAVAYAADLLTEAGIPAAGAVAATLRPVLDTSYRRITLLLPGAAASRGTIDVDLAWADLADRRGRALRLPHAAIVETKSGQRPGDLDRALWRAGHRPATLSKYGTGLAALHPSLPANRWRRVLTRHFAAALSENAAFSENAALSENAGISETTVTPNEDLR